MVFYTGGGRMAAYCYHRTSTRDQRWMVSGMTAPDEPWRTDCADVRKVARYLWAGRSGMKDVMYRCIGIRILNWTWFCLEMLHRRREYRDLNPKWSLLRLLRFDLGCDSQIRKELRDKIIQIGICLKLFLLKKEYENKPLHTLWRKRLGLARVP